MQAVCLECEVEQWKRVVIGGMRPAWMTCSLKIRRFGEDVPFIATKNRKVFPEILTLDIGAPHFDLWLPALVIAIPFASIKTFKRVVWAPVSRIFLVRGLLDCLLRPSWLSSSWKTVLQ